MSDTIDLYRSKEEAERASTSAWIRYTNLVQHGGSGEDRLTALRAAMQADRDVIRASQDWRRASGIGW